MPPAANSSNLSSPLGTTIPQVIPDKSDRRPEGCFIIRPLSPITIDYSDPNNAAPRPNHLFSLLFELVTNRLSLDSATPCSTFSDAIAESSFNANRAAAAAFDVNPQFASDFHSGLLIAMHRNELAKPLINDLSSVMSFTWTE